MCLDYYLKVGYLMKLLHMLSDVDDAWVKLVQETEDGVGKVVTEENTDSVNAAVLKQAGLLVKLKKYVRNELHRVEAGPQVKFEFLYVRFSSLAAWR